MPNRAGFADFRDLATSIGRFAGALAASAGRRGLAAVGLVALGGLLENAGLALLIPILNIVTAAAKGGEFEATVNSALGALGAETASGRLTVLLALFAVVALARATLLYARNIALSDIQTGFVEHARNRIIRRLALAPWSRIATLRHARINSLLTTEIQGIGASANFAIQGAVALGTLLIQSSLAFVLAPKLAAMAAMLVVIGGGIVVFALRRTHAIGAELGQSRLALMSVTTRFLGGLKAAMAQNSQSGFADEFAAFQAQTRRRRRERSRSRAFSAFAIALVPAIAGVAVVWIGSQTLGLRPTVLIAMIVLFARMTRPLATIYLAAQQFVLCVPAFDAVRTLETELAVDALAHPETLPASPSGAIVLEGVRFVYPGGRGVHGATMSLEPGSLLGITGASGAGKTTLVDLLVGLLKPQTGRITVGGQALQGSVVAAWQNTIAYVGQDAFLFHDTVRRNLIWGNGAADDQTLWRALEIAGAATLVDGLEHGLDTIIGERGALLSGGERQRIAIARALLRHSRLLVLDEATNAIGVESEAALLGRLATLDPRPTIVMIAHRAETLRRCDQIATIERGRPLAIRGQVPCGETATPPR